jgi:uncharacterized protein
MKIGVLHGSYGSPEGNWFPWLARMARDCGHEVVSPRFPTPENQNLRSWLDVFSRDFGQMDERCVLVGHSLSAAFILRLLEQSGTLAGVVLVSGFLGDLGLPEFDRVNATFTSEPSNWEVLRERAGRVLLLAGDNDPYVPLDRGLHLATQLATGLHVVPGGGHLNAEAGFTEFPYLWSMMRRLVLEGA